MGRDLRGELSHLRDRLDNALEGSHSHGIHLDAPPTASNGTQPIVGPNRARTGARFRGPEYSRNIPGNIGGVTRILIPEYGHLHTGITCKAQATMWRTKKRAGNEAVA